MQHAKSRDARYLLRARRQRPAPDLQSAPKQASEQKATEMTSSVQRLGNKLQGFREKLDKVIEGAEREI